MTTLSRDQIAGHATTAGFKGDDVNIAVAVALAESGGVTDARNPFGRDNSYGLWQINMIGGMGPDRRKKLGLSKNEELFDPETNARAAYMVWKEQGWAKGWTTYADGKYKKFYKPTADSGSGTPSKPPSEEPTSDGGITGAVNAIGSTMFKGLSNIAGILVAIVFLVIGVVLIARNQVTDLLPVGKVAKKVLK